MMRRVKIILVVELWMLDKLSKKILSFPGKVWFSSFNLGVTDWPLSIYRRASQKKGKRR